MPELDPCLLGLDAGNTVIKAVLFDTRGRQLAMHAADGRSHTPRPGHVERDLRELWDNARTAIGACIEAAAIDPRRIAAVGCAGHGNGLYLLDEADRLLQVFLARSFVGNGGDVLASVDSDDLRPLGGKLDAV